MSVPAPIPRQSEEEWSDFEIPDGQPIDKDDDDDDWDIQPLAKPLAIRPPIPRGDVTDLDDEDDDEGVSTIKVTSLASLAPKPRLPPPQDDDDFEDAFALPSDLTQLSLAPLSLAHRTSKSSLEWAGDKDHTSSSQSSDAYSTLGFADHPSSSSNSTSSVSLPTTETEDDDDAEEDLDGLVLPSDIFESGQGGRQLRTLLEKKKTAFAPIVQPKVASPEEDDFEMGLVIDDDMDLSPSRLLYNAQIHRNRNPSTQAQRQHSGLRPPSRLKLDRAKSPTNPALTLSRRLRMSPTPILRPSSRTQSFIPPPPAPSSSSLLTPKAASLRGQKSHTGLKPSPTNAPKLSRKASLSSLMESCSQASGSGSNVPGPSKAARYEESTAASRAKSYRTFGRIQGREYIVPPTRPSTPSTNAAALRLTLPTQSRLRSRPTISSVWNQAQPSAPSPTFRTSSPLSPRPPSSLAKAPRTQVSPAGSGPKVLKRPKRQRAQYDGTELDSIEDLPTDRDKESQFRVQPKNIRVPGGSYPFRMFDNVKGTIRKKSKRDVSASGLDIPKGSLTTRRSVSGEPSPSKKKKTNSSVTSKSFRKPTLIRNLGGANAAKVIGDMRWNPHTLRWEGNEVALRDFDPVVTSTRPALITHLTGSSIGSPVSTFASGARVVGTMMFDPENLRWVSTLPPEEDEPDVFANLADDEDDNSWEGRGGTIRAGAQQPGAASISSVDSNASTSSTGGVAPSPARSHTSASSDTDRGSRASMVYDIDDDFISQCRAAAERHKAEVSGWKGQQDVFADINRAYLYEIRAVATRNYTQ